MTQNPERSVCDWVGAKVTYGDATHLKMLIGSNPPIIDWLVSGVLRQMMQLQPLKIKEKIKTSDQSFRKKHLLFRSSHWKKN